MLLKDTIYKGMEAISVLYPEREAREMVFAYMEAAFGHPRHKHILEPDFMLSKEEVERALSDFGRMASGEPLQYVTGQAYFYGRNFRVTPDVLIPRQETELLCHNIVGLFRGKRQARILDLCTGSGCIAWTLALELPGALVTAVDISDGALSVAATQDFASEIASAGALMPTFVKADVLQESGLPFESDTRFDIIVSNPPYVMESEKPLMRANVLDHEPHLALFVPDSDPLVFYRAISVHARNLLAAGGVGMVEINEALGEETADIYRNAGFTSVSIVEDLHEKHRFVMFIA